MRIIHNKHHENEDKKIFKPNQKYSNMQRKKLFDSSKIYKNNGTENDNNNSKRKTTCEKKNIKDTNHSINLH